MNQIEFVDIVSKPVAITFRRIQTLGIYCWQYEKTERRAANFFSFFIVKRLLSFQDFVDLSHFSAVFSHYRTGVVLALLYPTAVGFVN